MFSNNMYEIGSKASVIRSIFEFAKIRKKEVGEENVFDFSLGNPSIPAPDSVKKAIIEILDEPPQKVHGYTSQSGRTKTKIRIAENLNQRFGTDYSADNLFMTMGAAASLSICIRALGNPNEEILTIAPYFPEYKCFVEASGLKFNVVPARESDFQIDFSSLEKMITKNTKAIIINSPNNPSGVVYSEETIIKLSDLLNKKSKEIGRPIFIIADEPYREIVYDGVEVPYIPNYYDNTLVCYSYSKSLSLPGERIGYVLVPNKVVESKKIMAAVAGAARILGYVCAPSLFQKVIDKCIGETSDISLYKKNRDILYNELIRLGYEVVKPQGAFYIFMKALEEDSMAFCERAKKYDLLFVPGDGFGCSNHVRISYCVNESLIRNSIPAFEKLIKEYKEN